MNIIQRLENIEQFIAQNETINKDFVSYSEGRKKEYAVENSSKIKSLFEEYDEENRLLRVGIVGRVKAGKSSLLNALLFNGNDILPKAATPMTAALTVMEYSEQIRAEVDFYTEQDIDDIARKAQDFETRLNATIQQKIMDLKQLPKNKGIADSELREKATKQAEREMKDDHHYASFDQYQRIKRSGIHSVSELAQFKILQANSIEDLMNNQLTQFVGADGKYMPFTKSIKLYIPEEGLKGLEIIDTPGINDPVTSRGERTEQLLKSCDVVLLVSPSGQFLSYEDMELMSRITRKEGIREAYIIASQVDSQLFGSAKIGLSTPSEVLAKISADLTAHARDTLSKQASKHSEMQYVLELFQKNNVICTSSVAFSQLQRFEQQHTWDSNLQHVWGNFTHHFPDTFNYPEMAKAALQQLANINAIKQIIDEVRAKKAEIHSVRKADIEKGQTNAIEDYLKSLDEWVNERIDDIQNSDIKDIKAQLETLNNQKEQIRAELLDVSDELLDKIKIDLSAHLKDVLKREIRKFSTDNAQETKSETRTESYEVRRERSWMNRVTFGLFGDSGGWETRYRDVTHHYTATYAGQIRSGIEEILRDLEDTLEPERYTQTQAWKKSLSPKITQVLRSVIGDNTLDYKLVQSAIRSVAAKIPDTAFYIDKNLPSSINKTGILRDSEGEKFLTDAVNYIHNLENNVREQINDYISDFHYSVQQVDISQKFVETLEDQVKGLMNDIENSKVRLYELETMKKNLASL